MALTPKQQRFVEEYLVDLNALQAAIRAGYSPTSAPATSSRLLDNRNVAEAIAAGQAERSKATGITVERILLEMGRLAFSDHRQGFNPDGSIKPPSEWSDDFAATVAAIEFEKAPAPVKAAKGRKTKAVADQVAPARIAKLRFWDKGKAVDMLAKHMGMFVEKIELGGQVQVTNTDLLQRLTPDERGTVRAVLTAALERQKPANQNAEAQAGVVPITKESNTA
jgi:phage terminase small subunit